LPAHGTNALVHARNLDRAPHRLIYLSALILLTVGYFVAGKIGLSLVTAHGSVSLIWP
jgi:hypothetical protein